MNFKITLVIIKKYTEQIIVIDKIGFPRDSDGYNLIQQLWVMLFPSLPAHNVFVISQRYGVYISIQ